MGAARTMILLVALVAAIGLAVVVRNMMAGRQAPAAVAEAAPVVAMTRVLVAQADLPVGARLSPEHLGWQSWPSEGLNPNFLTDGAMSATPAETLPEKAAEGAERVIENITGSPTIDSLIGAIVRDPILAGEPILRDKLIRGGEGSYLAVVLSPGARAMGVPISAESTAGGLILPGDRVDVIQSFTMPTPSGDRDVRVTEPEVVNIRVLAIDQQTRPAEDGAAMVGAVATLEVMPDAALALSEAIARGPLQLTLRSYADMNAPSGRASRGALTPDDGGGTIRVFSQEETTEVAVSR